MHPHGSADGDESSRVETAVGPRQRYQIGSYWFFRHGVDVARMLPRIAVQHAAVRSRALRSGTDYRAAAHTVTAQL